MKRLKESLWKLVALAGTSQPHHVFLVLALIYGLSFLIVTPPFQVPDERNHFLKAYQISTGQLTGVKEQNRVGGYIPFAVDSFSDYHSGMRGNMYAKTKASTIWNLRNLELVEDQLVFVDFPSTGKYSFVNYIPQSLSILVLRHLFSEVFWIYYGTKLLTLTFWLVCIAFAIYTIPFHKWLFTALALLPMSLYINSSVSGDVVTNAAAFILIAWLLKLAYGEPQVRIKDIAVLSILMVVLASTKLVYTPMLLLFILIPIRKFSSRLTYLSSSGILLLLTVGTALFWYYTMDSIYTPYSDYNPAFREDLNIKEGVNMKAQMQFLGQNPTHIFTVLHNAMGGTFAMVYEGYIGTFGWLDTRLPLWLIKSSYLILVFIAITEPGHSSIKITGSNRLVLLLGFCLILSMIILTLYLTWTYVGADYVHLQGRYLIPIMPLLFLVLYSTKWNLPALWRRVNQQADFPKVTPLLVVVFGLVSLSCSYKVIFDRFYNGPEFSKIEIHCGAEEIEEEYFVTSNPDVLLNNATTQTDEQSRTGDFAVKVDTGQRYSLTFRTQEIQYGDIISAEVWHKGEEAGLVLQMGADNELYTVVSHTDSTDAQGWSRIRVEHVFMERVNGKQTAIYLFNYGDGTAYFDDLTITIKKPKR